MDHRKNFVRAMKVVDQLDKLLAQMDDVFREYHQLVLTKGKGEIDKEGFLYQVQQLGAKRQRIFKAYEELVKIMDNIKNEYGGEIRE